MTFLGMTAVLVIVLVGQYLLYEKLGFRNVTYTLSISTSEAYENDEIEIVEEIENAKRLPLVWARSEISCSPYLRFKGQTLIMNEESEQRGLVSGIFRLGGYRKCRRVWRVRCERRGLMKIDDVTITISDLFGFARKTRMYRLSDTVRVLPVPADMDTGELSGDMFIGNMPVRRFVLPDPFMISGAREYTGREPMNRIHWLQTARTGELMVYNNEFTTERRVMIVLNLEHGLYNHSISETALELEIKAAAFVLDYCLKMSAECALLANSVDTLELAAGSGYEHTINALRGLAELNRKTGFRLDEMLRTIDFHDITDVILITPYVSEYAGEVLEGLRGRGKCCKIFTAGLVTGEENVPQSVELMIIPRDMKGGEQT